MSTFGSILFCAVVGWIAVRLTTPAQVPAMRSLLRWLYLSAYLVAAGAILGFLLGDWLGLIGLPLGGGAFLLFVAVLRRWANTQLHGGSTK
jgi:hypothetical protein